MNDPSNIKNDAILSILLGEWLDRLDVVSPHGDDVVDLTDGGGSGGSGAGPRPSAARSRNRLPEPSVRPKNARRPFNALRERELARDRDE